MDANLDDVTKVLSTLNPLFTERRPNFAPEKAQDRVDVDTPMSLFPDEDLASNSVKEKQATSLSVRNKVAIAASAATCIGIVVGLATGTIQSLARTAALKAPIGKELLMSIANLPSLAHRRSDKARVFDGDSSLLINPSDLWKRLNYDRLVFNLDTQRIEQVTKFTQKDTLSFDTDVGDECVVWRYFRNTSPEMFVCKVVVTSGESFQTVERRYRLATTQELFYHGSDR